MTLPKIASKTIAWAAVLVSLTALQAGAYAPPAGSGGACEHGMRGPPGPPGGPMRLMGSGPGPGPGGMDFDDGRPPPYLHDIALSDEQEDRVFAIVHAAAPGLREQGRAARRARESLRALARSPKFDEAQASSLSSAQARAESQVSLMRSRVEHDIYAVLTAEQRKHVEDREHDGREHGGPPLG